MIRLTAPPRGKDSHGSGEYGASRAGGNRIHNGIDFLAMPGSRVHAIRAGTVTKLGYPYGDDLGFRYVQVTDADGNDWRYFYVKPSVVVGGVIEFDTPIGFVQDLDTRYKGIPPHIHLEIKDIIGKFINPMELTA
jgi:murein DD-endopeptidase MepM/ murein hydrolase activator NlpD